MAASSASRPTRLCSTGRECAHRGVGEQRGRAVRGSRLGATPSSRRNTRSRRSNWRSAAWRSPAAAWRRISSRWARFVAGSRSATASQRHRGGAARGGAGAAARGGPRPVLVAVLREQLAAVDRQRLWALAASPAASAARAEVSNRTASISTTESANSSTVSFRSTIASGEACCLTSEVGGLVQLRHGIVDVVVGPHRVEDLLAVQATAGSEGEEFDQRGRVPAAPEALGHDATVDGDLESPEQPDCNLSHRSTSLKFGHANPHGRVRRRQCTPESTDAQVG